MIHFYKEQVELAVKLVDIKSKYDDIKASKDVARGYDSYGKADGGVCQCGETVRQKNQ